MISFPAYLLFIDTLKSVGVGAHIQRCGLKIGYKEPPNGQWLAEKSEPKKDSAKGSYLVQPG